MNRSHLWKLVLILLVVAWSVSEIYPPTSKDLIEAFEQQSSTPNKTFDEIVKKAQQLDASNTDRAPGITYSNLLVAISTNDIRPFFPSNYINAAVERDVTRGILNRVQRSAAGQFRLGLDLQGGTQFLLEMDMSRAQTNAGAMMNADFIAEQAVEVLRRRVDRFGVSEPVIAPAGGGRILVQLPGLSEADKQQAKAQIQKAAFLEFRMVHPDSEGQISAVWCLPVMSECMRWCRAARRVSAFRRPSWSSAPRSEGSLASTSKALVSDTIRPRAPRMSVSASSLMAPNCSVRSLRRPSVSAWRSSSTAR